VVILIATAPAPTTAAAAAAPAAAAAAAAATAPAAAAAAQQLPLVLTLQYVIGFENLKLQWGGGVRAAFLKRFEHALTLIIHQNKKNKKRKKNKMLFFFRVRHFWISCYRIIYKVKCFLENQLGPPNSTGPIRESEAIPKKYFANFGFDFGIPLISHKPIRDGAGVSNCQIKSSNSGRIWDRKCWLCKI
jgi:hypothetical protein